MSLLSKLRTLRSRLSREQQRAPVAQPKPKLDRALLIGINYEGTGSQLNGCRQDVQSIRRFLESRFDCGEIRILDEKDSNISARPTRQNIINSIKWLVSEAKSDSRYFFHFSGHGSWVRDLNGDEDDGRDEVLCPLDYSSAGMIVDDDVRKLLVDPLPEGAKLWGVFDCCHSGTQADLKYLYKVDLYDERREYRIVESQSPKSKGFVYIWSGCADPQSSADAFIAENRRTEGAMTWGLLKTIEDLERGSKQVTYKNVIQSLSKLLKSRGYTQQPQFSTGHFCDLNAVLFA